MFKRSIFGQLFSFTVLLLLLSVLFIATLLYGFLGGYVTQREEQNLEVTAEAVKKLTTLYMQSSNALSLRNYKVMLDSLSNSSGAFVIVLDVTGKVFVTTGDQTGITMDEGLYQGVLEGRDVKLIGTVGGLFNTTMLTIGTPLMYQDEVAGAIFLSSPVPEINQIRTDVLRIFLVSVSIVILVALVVIYAMSRRLTQPLKQLNAAAKRIASGEFAGRVQLDVENEIGELGDTFNEMAESLMQLEDMRSSFISSVSHELRTPMTTITGFVEGILDGTIPPERQKQYLTIVLEESRRLSRLVTDLLDMTKLEKNKLTLDLREFDINEQLRLQIIKAERRIEEKDIDVMVDFESPSQKVWADKDSILRVLTNLLDNAIKFTPEGGYIELRSGLSDGKVFVSMTNSGMGIEPEDARHIFDRFYKTDKSRSLDKNGVGLGLYLVKSLLQAHGQDIWVTSEVGKYTRFTFTLAPYTPPPAKRERGQNKSEQ